MNTQLSSKVYNSVEAILKLLVELRHQKHCMLDAQVKPLAGAKSLPGYAVSHKWVTVNQNMVH